MSYRDPAVGPIKEKVRRHVVRSRRRLQDFFKDFDRLNHKTVTFAQAARALDNAGVRLSQQELDVVCNKYAESGGLFNYLRFCDAIDKVFTAKGLEKRPGATPKSPLRGSTLRAGFGRLTLADDPELLALLRRARVFVRTHGLVVKEFFRDFDKLNSGIVTKQQFRRELERCFSGAGFSDRELSRIVERYCVANVDGDGHVDADYRRLHNELEDPTFLELSGPPSKAGAHEPPRNRRVGMPLVPGAEDRDPLAHVIRAVAERRVRLKEFFVDYDRLRSGFCTRAQFLRVLHIAAIPDITEADMEALADHYWDPARLMVRYQEFAGDVDKAFTIPSLEKAPMASVETEQRRIAQRRRGVGAPDLTEAERERAEELIANIRERVAQRRIHMKDKFRDFDRHRTQTVTRDRFRRVMAIAGLVPSDALPREEDLFVLQRYYQAEGRTDAVQYAAFLHDIGGQGSDGLDATARMGTVGSQTGTLSPLAMSGRISLGGTATAAAAAGTATAGAVSLADLLARIRQYAVQNQVHPGEFLCDYDKLRHGRCTRAQFSAGVRAAFPFLRNPMVRALQEHYVDAAAVDPAGEPYVAWRQFTDDVDVAFTKKGLEKEPLEDVDFVTAAATTMVEGVTTPPPRLSREEEHNLRDLLNALGLEVRTKRILMRPTFQSFDRHNRGFIPGPQFRRVLVAVGLGPIVFEHRTASMYGARVRDGGFMLLEKAFRMPSDDQLDVNYNWFMTALDTPDDVLGSLPGDDDFAATSFVATQTLRGKHPQHDKPIPFEEPTSTPPRARRVARSEVDMDALMAQMREHAARRRIRVHEFFVDFDPVRHGRVTRAKLRTALDNAGFRLRDEEFEALADRFRAASATRDDMVEYRELIYALDGGNEHLEKSPRKQVETLRLTKPTELTSEEKVDQTRLMEVIAILRDYVTVRRIPPKPMFEARDFNHIGLVSRSQFLSAMDQLGLLHQVGLDGAELIMDAYRCPRPVHHDKVNYVKFCSAVDPDSADWGGSMQCDRLQEQQCCARETD
eukprot:CAMPEP_0196770714 /NCGR_PEP_ID=MMETSP1104-20130614/1291_1 /TAXON_ID=33652 /ORGANISM="Cafeteria sp., Strain Caron Lab Isolate" /LENGTH=1022 /DNA_ID=CAMNT_0042140829 /DNA_START=17 /DNA_END=3083 /DNA_ORIENTATION=+